MKICIGSTKENIGRLAALEGIRIIRKAIEENGVARIVLATGASQFEMLKALVLTNEIDWSSVVMFHLDEYIGLQADHPASFRKYLTDRFLNLVPPLKEHYLINGEGENARDECEKLSAIIAKHTIDVAFVGIGENGHLAFNDPPADFENQKPYIVVDLDEACRRQQVAEGWFSSLEKVPGRAITMSVRQIMKSKHIICSVPGKRKAKAVRDSIENEVSELYPSSVLREHERCSLYLDEESSRLVSQVWVSE